jgi:hypothetical protein
MRGRAGAGAARRDAAGEPLRASMPWLISSTTRNGNVVMFCTARRRRPPVSAVERLARPYKNAALN